ncbi:hypothetical protein GOP47_0028164 [Adiantum capillus-veneris]|nr:hypothetical protein GOP47_0028164 [Adiantum capillus-veneris]
MKGTVPGMMVIQGVLKIKVIKGTDLVVRDLFSSDPYVKLSIGEHEVKTRVIRNDLNPKWNEELTLAVPDPPLPLKLYVLDRDMFKADDKMGDAEIDLRTLVAAAKLKAGLQFQEGMNIRKIVATNDNHFATDSVIKFKDGHIVQEICIKLQNVEKGQIELELRWQPRDP